MICVYKHTQRGSKEEKKNSNSKKKSNLKMALDVWNCEPFNIHQLKNKLRCSLWIKEEIKKNHQKLFIERNWSENKQTILLTTRNRESEQKCVRKGSAYREWKSFLTYYDDHQGCQWHEQSNGAAQESISNEGPSILYTASLLLLFHNYPLISLLFFLWQIYIIYSNPAIGRVNRTIKKIFPLLC